MSEKKVNQVIVNGEELINLRNDTVSPQTLVRDETATNKEGAKIVGELDPVSHNEAYLIDDPEGDIDDSDYIPFNDVSDEEQPKKKTLFSSIVEKLKSVFQVKSWGHVELINSSETLRIKDTQVDAIATDNGVTSTHYPSSNDIVDNNNKIIARNEAVVMADGKIKNKMYSQNYDTEGNSVGHNYFATVVDKSGNMSYEVSDPNAFRSAIKTVDQLGTDIPSNADMNTYKTAGTYRVPSDAIGATISNLPLALCGKVVVFNNGNGGFEQFYFPNHNPKIYVRTWWNNAWSSWKEIGEGGGDGKDHTYEMGTEIPANSDLDDYDTEGVYYIGSNYSTIDNKPEDNTSGKLLVTISKNKPVVSSDDGLMYNQFLISGRGFYVRWKFSYGNVWNNWTRYPWKEELYLLDDGTEIPDNSDLNKYCYTTGTYSFYGDTSTISHCPTTKAFKLVVDFLGGRSLRQTLFECAKENNDVDLKIYTRVRTTGIQVHSWSSWAEIGTSDSKPHTYEKGTEIPANSDLNTYTTIGVYQCLLTATARTMSNLPYTGNDIQAFKLIVSTVRGTANIIQMWIPFSTVTDCKICYRTTDDNGTTWQVWNEITTKNDLYNYTHYLSNIYDIDSSHRILHTDDLNDFTDSGTYQYNYNAEGLPANCPFSSIRSFKLIVDRFNADSRSEIMQRITMQNIGEDECLDWYRVRRWDATTWGAWKHLASTDDVYNILDASLGTEILANSDLNDYKTFGVYRYSAGNASTISNRPLSANEAIVLWVMRSWDNSYIRQIAFMRNTQRIATRTFRDNTTWEEWKALAYQDEITPSMIGNGYAVATVSGSAITATISGFKLRAGVIVAINTDIPQNATLNINNTGAKNLYWYGSSSIDLGDDITLSHAVYTIMYDGTNYRIIGYSKTPTISDQAYVANTSGNIVLTVGAIKNAFQIKYNLSNDKLVWNYYKNSAWRGDRTLIEEIESGIIKLHRETTTADDLPVGLEASIKDTTTGKTYTRRIIRAYQDHQATPYGLNLLFDGGGNTIVGGGESSTSFYNVMTNQQKVNELLYLLSDGGIILESNADAIADRTGLKIVDSKLIPIKAEVNTDNFFDLGSSSNKFKGVYAHNMFLHSPQGRTVVGGAHSLGVSDTIPNILNELRYSNGAWGSFNLTTAYTKDYTTIPTGWYNYFYIPHRVGGENWAKPTSWDADNISYGTLMLFGMNNTNGMFRIRMSIVSDAVNVSELEDLQKGNCYVGTCTTAGGTKDKVATVDGNFVLRKGVRVAIKFSNTNTANSTTANPVTLNVNNTGAKYIWRWQNHTGAQDAGTDTIIFGVAGRYNFYIYDGTYWVWAGASGDNNSTNFLRNDASSIAKVNDASPYITLKSSVIDITQSNNGVSSTSYPAFIIEDKNGKCLSRLEAIVETGGNVATYLQVRNYKSDGTTPNGGIKVFMNKNGGIWYVISSAENFNAALGIGYGTCTTAADTAAKVVTLANYVLVKNGIIVVRFDYNVPANATLNVNNRGAKAIHYRGGAISANVILAGDRVTLIYNGGNYDVIGIDRTPNYNDVIIKNYNNTATIKNTGVQTLEEITLSAGVWIVSWREQSNSSALVNIAFGFSATKKTASTNFSVQDGYYGSFARTGATEAFTCSFTVRLNTSTKLYAQHFVGGSTALTSAFGYLNITRVS